MKFKYRFLVFLQIIHFSISLKFVPHPESDLSMEQKIKKYGYPLETHEVTTEDDYILTLHRIPYGRRQPSTNATSSRSPVLLLHGMGAQPEFFLLLGRNSIVYYLADRGYDVWLLNARGTMYSEKHKYYDIEKDPRFWQFSYHEIGVYDLPANIDYIVNKTQQKVHLIGHSQGTTCYFVMAAERPEYNDKVKVSVSYAPSLLMKYMDYPVAVIFSYGVELFELVYNLLGMTQLFPINDTLESLTKLLCSEITYFRKICLHLLSIIGSHESTLFSQELATLIFSVRLPRISAKQLFHYMQSVKTGTFRQYDYGDVGNMRRYKTKTPPDYNISNVVSPVALFYAERDDLIPIKGAEETARVLPNVILNYVVPYKYFNHVDFLFGHNASSLVYRRTVQLFRDFDSGKINNLIKIGEKGRNRIVRN